MSANLISVDMQSKQVQTEFVWRLVNFTETQNDERELCDLRTEVILGQTDSVYSKWLASFQLTSGNNLELICQLLEHNTSSDLTVTGKVSFSNVGESGPFLCLEWQTLPKRLTTNQYIKFDLGWSVLKNPIFWIPMCDTNKNIYLKLELALIGTLPLTGNAWTIFDQTSQLRLQANLENMLLNGDFADFKIICADSKEFNVNRAVLSARNLVFERMLKSNMLESKTGIVRVADINGKTMEVILHFFYTGKLLPAWSSREIIEEFIYAVGKYQISELLVLTDNVLASEQIPTSNIQLLSLVNKLRLLQAEKILIKQLKACIENFHSVT